MVLRISQQAVAFGLVALALACGTESHSPEGTPQFPAPSGVLERAHFETLADAIQYADLVVVATPEEFKPWAEFETAGGRSYGSASAELRIDSVIKGEPTDPVVLDIPAGENNTGLAVLNEYVAGRPGLFILTSKVAYAEREGIQPFDAVPGRYMIANSQAVLLDGGPGGAYSLYSTEDTFAEFPKELEGMPFDELVAHVAAMSEQLANA